MTYPTSYRGRSNSTNQAARGIQNAPPATLGEFRRILRSSGSSAAFANLMAMPDSDFDRLVNRLDQRDAKQRWDNRKFFTPDPTTGKQPVKRDFGKFRSPSAVRMAARVLPRSVRLNPAARGLGLAWDVADLYGDMSSLVAVALNPGSPQGWDLHGWDLRWECTAGPYPPTRRLDANTENASPNLACLGNQTVANSLAWGSPVTTARRKLTGLWGPTPTQQNGLKAIVCFTRPGTGPTQQPEYRPAVAPSAIFAPIPNQTWEETLDPFKVPIGQFVGNPKPLPWVLVPKWSQTPHMAEQSFRGTDGRRRSHATPLWRYGTVVRPGRRKAVPKGPHVSRPPGKGEKEQKRQPPKALARAFGIATGATEAIDLIDAFYEALPKEYRLKKKPSRADDRWGYRISREPTPQEKLLQLYIHWDKVDFEAAMINVVKNHLIDGVIGTISGGADSQLRKMGGSGLSFALRG